jgi:hypothetical protein
MLIEEVDAIYYNEKIILKEELRDSNIIAINSHFAYDEIKPFYEGMAAVKRNKKWGFVNNQGEEVIPCIYDLVDNFSEGYAGVRIYKSGRWGFLDKNGVMFIKDKFIDIQPFSEGYAAVLSELEYKWGYIDYEGYLATPFEYDEVTEFEDGLAVVQKNHQLMLIDKNNNRLSNEEEIKYLETKKKHIITGDNKIISNKRMITKDGFGTYFHNTVDNDGTKINQIDKKHGVVKRHGKYGYVDQYKDAITPIMFDSVSNFIDGVAIVSIDDKYSMIDETGNYITSGVYHYNKSENKTHNYRYAMIDKHQIKVIEAKDLYGLKISLADDTKIVWYNTRMDRELATENVYNMENGYRQPVKTLMKNKN